MSDISLIGTLITSTQPNITSIPLQQNITFSSETGNLIMDPIKIGLNVGVVNQQSGAISIGVNAGTTEQGTNSIAIGLNAGSDSIQGTQSIAIGFWAGITKQSHSSIAIGANSGITCFWRCAQKIGNGIFS